jgi:predicted O-methyltransferase YrrM
MIETTHPITDPLVNSVLARLQALPNRPADGVPRGNSSARLDPFIYRDYRFSIDPEQGDLIYFLCRAIGARRAAEFATSFGVSTIYLAAAIRDNGGGRVIGSELVPEKVAMARRNLAEAGLSDYVDLREGDARETLRDIGGAADFVLIDGWPGGEQPSLARQVIALLAPQMREGAIVMNDNGEADYLSYIRNPANGFRTMSLPIKRGTELSIKLA